MNEALRKERARLLLDKAGELLEDALGIEVGHVRPLPDDVPDDVLRGMQLFLNRYGLKLARRDR